MLVDKKYKKSNASKTALIFIEDGSFTYDNRVIHEAQALVDQGWNITVISPKYMGDSFCRRINEKLRAYHYPKPVTESMAGHLIESLFSIFFGFLLTFYVHFRHGFSVFQACNPMDVLWLIAAPYKAAGKKFIFDQHDLVPELILSRGLLKSSNIIYKITVLLEKFSYKLADAVISTNESYKKIAVFRGGKRFDKVFVVRNGPDLNKFTLVPPKSGLKRNGEVLVGYLGNMNPQDGVEYLINAAEIIIKKFGMKHIKFIFIGGGSSQQRLAYESKKRGLEEFVKFTGRIPDNEMLSILSAFDICVQPDPKSTFNDLSTMNKVLEYMALRKPVVTFDLKETRVSCGPAAIYGKPNDSDDLAEKIIYLANNPERRQELGKLGRERIERMLSWDFSIPNLLEAYRHALKKGKNPV